MGSGSLRVANAFSSRLALGAWGSLQNRSERAESKAHRALRTAAGMESMRIPSTEQLELAARAVGFANSAFGLFLFEAPSGPA
jgi:hypothetical protein